MNQEMVYTIAEKWRIIIKRLPELEHLEDIPNIEMIAYMIYNIGFQDGLKRVEGMIDKVFYNKS